MAQKVGGSSPLIHPVYSFMYLYIDPEKCCGCKLCEVVCSFRWSKSFSPIESAITILEDRKSGLTIPVVCQNCVRPICVDVCVSGALQKEEGVIKADENKCVGCKTCMTSCPFGAISFIPQRGVIRKCDLCENEPECMKLCPYNAIELISEEKLASKIRLKFMWRILGTYAI